MTEILLILTCFIVSLSAVPIITYLSEKFGIVDLPDVRKIHQGKVPLLGGLGIFIGYIAAVMVVGEYSSRIIFYLVGSIIIVITGVIDDVRAMTAIPKLVGQIAAATVIIFFAGIRFEITSDFFLWINHPAVSIFLTYLWIVGVTNALNLIDGMDGLAGGISFIALGAIAIAAQMKGLEIYFLISLGLMGSILGFLRYNIPPAKIFMGDTGSLFLGFNIAVLSLVVSHKSGTVLSVLIPLLFISLPVFDTLLAICRRLIQRKNPLSPDKDHLHHRLLNLEFSTAQALIIFYSISIILSMISILTLNRGIVWGAVFSFMILYCFLLSLKLLHLFDAGDKIRIFNEKLRAFAIKVSTGDKVSDIRVKIINYVIAIITLILLFNSVIAGYVYTYTSMLSMFFFLFILVLIVFYRKVFHIKNEFLSFVLFWLYFYISYNSFKDGENQFALAMVVLLAFCVLFKIIFRKRFDLFISNPMEFLIIFCLILIKIRLDMEISSFLLISISSFIIYYANKVYFTREYHFYKYYIGVVGLIILISPIQLYYSIYDEARIANLENAVTSGIYITPIETKLLMKSYYQGSEFAKGRELLLYVDRFDPIWKIKDIYKYEAGKIYSRLIIDNLFSGDIEKSNQYLAEYISIFPELVEDFYAVVEPVLRNAGKIGFRDIQDFRIHGNSINEIVNIYSNTIDELANTYKEKGYISRSRRFAKVSEMLQRLVS